MRLWPAGKNKFIDKLIMIRPFRLLSLSIASAIIFTQIIVMPMSIFFRGKVAYDLVITGVVCSFFVSLVICYLLVHLISHVHENEKRYRRLFEVESDAILLVDCETNRILDANVAASNLYGYTHEELLRLKATDVSRSRMKPVRLWLRTRHVFPSVCSVRKMALCFQSKSPVAILTIRDTWLM